MEVRVWYGIRPCHFATQPLDDRNRQNSLVRSLAQFGANAAVFAPCFLIGSFTKKGLATWVVGQGPLIFEFYGLTGALGHDFWGFWLFIMAKTILSYNKQNGSCCGFLGYCAETHFGKGLSIVG